MKETLWSVAIGNESLWGARLSSETMLVPGMISNRELLTATAKVDRHSEKQQKTGGEKTLNKNRDT